jgi:hypothetical protein
MKEWQPKTRASLVRCICHCRAKLRNSVLYGQVKKKELGIVLLVLLDPTSHFTLHYTLLTNIEIPVRIS